MAVTALSMLTFCLATAPLAADDAVQLSMDSPFLDLSATEQGDDVRWLSIFVTVTNHTDSELRIPPNAWLLRDTRGTHTPAPITSSFIAEYDIVNGDEPASLQTFQPREVIVEPNKQERGQNRKN